MNTVYTLTFEEPEINEREILRYMSSLGGENELHQIINECLNEVRDKLTYKTCYVVLPIDVCENKVILPCGEIESKHLSKNLSGCDETYILAATIGVEIDRLISKYSRLSPSKALCFQAIGAERVEALCDDFCADINKKLNEKGKKLKPRFSPGYGDLPLETQKMIFGLLDCSKKIGITLGDSLLMSPSKSVTAFAGITKR
jgi:hypothetical protein